MKVHSIEISGFMSHDATSIEFPERGVVVLTGENGSGKSSLIEAISVAHWGRTLRGTPAWRKDVRGELEVHSSLVSVSRSAAPKGSQRLRWCSHNEALYRDYDTKTKAETELAKMVGDHEIWRRTHVFSSSDAVNFSTSTDGKRKRFIEQILGLDRFDSAHDKCKTELVERRSALMGARSTLAHAQELFDEATTSYGVLVDPAPNLPAAPEPLPEPEGGKGRMIELAAELQTIEDQLRAFSEQPTEAADPAVRERHMAAVTRESDAVRVFGLTRAAKCGLCGQPYTLVDYSEAETERDDALRELSVTGLARDVEDERVTQAHTDCARKVRELNAEAQRLRRAWDAMDYEFAHIALRDGEIERHAQIREAALLEYEKTLTHNRQRRAELDSKIFDYEERIDEVTAEVAAFEAEVAELEACAHVLGLKGVRVPVLGHALEAAEFFANGGLAGMGRAGLKIRLRPYRVLAKGTTNTDIGFEVEGAGGGYGYDASSGGERRRIDACLLLAFAEVSAAGSGCPDGTLWVDELFDAIDVDGCAAAARMLAGIGERRCVVVITHREDLARQIPAAARYRVDGGVLTQVA